MVEESTITTIPKIKRGHEILDQLFEIIGDLGYTAGGFARWCCSVHPEPAPYTDIDIVCRNEQDYQKLFSILSKSPYVEGPNGTTHLLNNLVLNLLKPHAKMGNPAEVIEMFDISVCQYAITKDRQIYTTDIAIYDEAGKRFTFLKYENDLYEPIKRIIKYVAKGYRFTNNDIRDLVFHYYINDWEPKYEVYDDSGYRSGQ